MEELLSVMMEIRDQLIELNSKMDVLTGGGLNSISDITEAIESVKGPAGYDLSDVHSSIESIKGSTGYDLTDIHSSLSNENRDCFRFCVNLQSDVR
ncbi:MAG: hypothetical protein AWM53_00885 [Candidatus Dichloromethanomonas elyunquensis]|nr:MAG: hypothetical protein AWM53_00885 [Candidatus Dichloromethanomonas elyunquensis]